MAAIRSNARGGFASWARARATAVLALVLGAVASVPATAEAGWPHYDYQSRPYTDVGGPGYGGSRGRPSLAYTKSYRRASRAFVLVDGQPYRPGTLNW